MAIDAAKYSVDNFNRQHDFRDALLAFDKLSAGEPMTNVRGTSRPAFVKGTH